MARDLSPKDKHSIVQSLWTSVNEGGAALKDVPLAVKNVLISEAWREREWNGRPIKHATFRAFIETPPIEGCGWPLDKVEKLIQDDGEVLEMWRKAITDTPGGDKKSEDYKSKIIHNNIMNDKSTRKSPIQGTSRAYTLSRLKEEAPELFGRTCLSKKNPQYLSPNAAAIQAGFRRPPPTPFDQAKKLIGKLSPEERAKLKEML